MGYRRRGVVPESKRGPAPTLSALMPARCISKCHDTAFPAGLPEPAIEENVLAIRTDSANRRVVAETTRRLSALTVGELAYLAGPDSSTSDREALMWIAMCRYYAIIGEFAGEVLKKAFPDV